MLFLQNISRVFCRRGQWTTGHVLQILCGGGGAFNVMLRGVAYLLRCTVEAQRSWELEVCLRGKCYICMYCVEITCHPLHCSRDNKYGYKNLKHINTSLVGSIQAQGFWAHDYY